MSREVCICVFCIVCCLATTNGQTTVKADYYDQSKGSIIAKESVEAESAGKQYDEAHWNNNNTELYRKYICKNCHEDSFFIQEIFAKFGGNQSHLLTYDGFVKLLQKIGLTNHSVFSSNLSHIEVREVDLRENAYSNENEQHKIQRRDTIEEHKHGHPQHPETQDSSKVLVEKVLLLLHF